MSSQDFLLDAAYRRDAAPKRDLDPRFLAKSLTKNVDTLTSPVIAISVGTQAPVNSDTRAQVFQQDIS